MDLKQWLEMTAECICAPHCRGPSNLAEKCWVYTKLGYSSLLLGVFLIYFLPPTPPQLCVGDTSNAH